MKTIRFIDVINGIKAPFGILVLFLALEMNALAASAPTDGLVGYWTFDEGSGATVKDTSGNNQNGTIIKGGVWSSGAEATGST